MSNPADLLALAETLKAAPGASRRAALSRAYYAAFHALQDAVSPMVDPKDFGRHGCASHGAVLSSLRNWQSKHPDKKLAMAHGADAIKAYSLLVTCIDERERADYVMGPNGEADIRLAIAVIGKAERVMKFARKACAK